MLNVHFLSSTLDVVYTLVAGVSAQNRIYVLRFYRSKYLKSRPDKDFECYHFEKIVSTASFRSYATA